MRLEEAERGMRDIAETLIKYDDEPPNVRNLMAEHLVVKMHRAGGERNTYRHHSHQDVLDTYGTLRSAPIWVPSHPVFDTMKIQECFWNAYTAVTELEGYTYVEGHARIDWTNIVHAWIEDEEGRIIDPTWRHLDHKDEPIAYYGVRFDQEFLMRHVLETEKISIFMTDYEIDHPMMRHGFVTDIDEQGREVVIDYGE